MNVIDGQAGRVRYYSLIFYSLTINNILNIIILLILSGITISSLINTGLFEKSREAKEKYEEIEKEQRQTLIQYEKELNKNTSEELSMKNANVILSTTENVELHDKKGNKIVVPAGFKVVVNEETNKALTVDKGIVIEDVSNETTKGSQFVWIPVNNITKTDNSIVEINLNRYTFSEDGIPTAQNDRKINNCFTELESSQYNNTKAKDIKSFKESVEKNKGFYMGRYEARKSINGTITEKGTDNVWNNIGQVDAATQSRNMYQNKTSFTSDLVNSYAWDTTTVFLQYFGTNKQYSVQKSINTSYSNIGTNTQDVKDVQCNIYDMASNVFEWSTETCENTYCPLTSRGGKYGDILGVRSRIYRRPDQEVGCWGFRPILYLHV